MVNIDKVFELKQKKMPKKERLALDINKQYKGKGSEKNKHTWNVLKNRKKLRNVPDIKCTNERFFFVSIIVLFLVELVM